MPREKNADSQKLAKDQMVAPPAAEEPSRKSKGKQKGKNNRPQIGGTAVQGAKSTQPKVVTASNPQQQQVESYNRTMRRRMQQLGTTPEQQAETSREKRQKKLERRQKRIEERKKEVKRVASSGPRNISLGRRNTYFLIATALVIVAIIVLVALFRYGIL